MLTALLPLLILLVLCLVLPLLGAVLGHQPLGQFLQLPLTGRNADALPPDLSIAMTAGALLLTGLALVLWFARRQNAPTGKTPQPRSGVYPRWGWAGIGSLALAVLFGNSGADALSSVLLLTGLILTVNADTQRRTGTSMVSARPGFFLTLFPAGALIGWCFYWINLFLQIWSYPDADGALTFVPVATLEYACLLPAMLSLRQWLGSFPTLLGLWSNAAPIPFSGDQQLGWLLVGLGSIGLAGATLWADWIFPMTWAAPLLLAVGFQLIRGIPTLFAGITWGDWSRILLPALAALLLGILVRGWDTAIGPNTVFHLSRIDLWPIFGMPVIAYAGLLPLGLFAVWIGDQLTFPWKTRPLRRLPKFPVKIRLGTRD